ncbi:MAG: NifX-associated nitrogen fixation protein [Cyanothece sp. SIO2G6]|nr:NifX-associated nitrogen fixation protein [Cyanothece sp. SIO2G6]
MTVANSTPPKTETEAMSVADSPFLQAIVQQIRANDPYGTYRNWADELLLKPFIMSKAEKREIPVEGDIDPMTKGRIFAFYRAIAARIEEETGQLATVVVDLSHEGFGWVLIFAGRLILVSRTLRDAQRFGYASIDKMAKEGEKLTQKGVEMATKYSEVCDL